MQSIVNGISYLPEILRKVECQRLFLVVDSSYPFLNIKESIENLPHTKVMFSDFTPNPTYEQVCTGIEIMKSSKCDTILALGGGSAIDVAKCIKLSLMAKEGDKAIIPPLVSEMVDIDDSLFPFIAIPTTAGTGSESTHNAVMYYNGAKQTVTNDALLPDYAILEPSILKTLPLYQKKCTLMDALCQSIESWWSVNSTDESKEYSKKAIDLIMSNWQEYIFNNNAQAAGQIMLAANYGGRAINIAQTTAAHAMSYKLSSMYQLPHGHAVAICLPEIWEAMIKNMDQIADSRGKKYVENIFKDISVAMGDSHVNATISRIRQMVNDLDLNNPIVVNDWTSQIEILSKSVNPVRLKNNPVQFTFEQIEGLYSSIVKHG